MRQYLRKALIAAMEVAVGSKKPTALDVFFAYRLLLGRSRKYKANLFGRSKSRNISVVLNELSCLSPILFCTTRIVFQERGDRNVEPVAYPQHDVDRGHAASGEMRLQSTPGYVTRPGECIDVPARHNVHARFQIRGEYAVQ